MPDNDPRVFFAAERTLLAWLRTAIGLIGMGFVVARFGLFLQLVRPHDDPKRHAASAILGVALALVGSLTAAVATWQHRRYCRTLPVADLPPCYRGEVAVGLGFGVTVAGAVLALELILT
jgi:putative membrane protein